MLSEVRRGGESKHVRFASCRMNSMENSLILPIGYQAICRYALERFFSSDLASLAPVLSGFFFVKEPLVMMALL